MISRVLQFWRQRFLGLLVSQLRQGISPQKIALTLTLGVCVSAFPIVGTTSVICFFLGLWLRLNQPVIQFVNWLASPLQMGLLLVFVRFGEWLTRAHRVRFSIPELWAKFHASPAGFFREFGLTCWHGIIGWFVVAPVAGVLLYGLFLFLTRQLARQTEPLGRAQE
jgi:uncharacterized protein (DUF2062 family)